MTAADSETDEDQRGRQADIAPRRGEKTAIQGERPFFVVAAPLAAVLGVVGVVMLVWFNPAVGFALVVTAGGIIACGMIAAVWDLA